MYNVHEGTYPTSGSLLDGYPERKEGDIGW